ncbi:P-loop containing nucleoside triphosphate hydrolase protein [Biscogniauxia marginata]|nr:P-loop containing nucleoside triphosphate hydrolase protein [Biscogniauxia marginata]
MSLSQSQASLAGRKRPAGLSTTIESDDQRQEQQEQQHPNKRHQNASSCSSRVLQNPGKYLIIHQVRCSRESAAHQRHAESKEYLDVPRLFEGDCRASALRGMSPFPHQDEYLEDHPEIEFTVIKYYACERYHAEVEHDFERLRMPNLEHHEAVMVRPYFSVLRNDGPPAETTGEDLEILSKELIRALDGLKGQNTERPKNEAFGRSFSAPYISFYHLRELVPIRSADTPNSLTLEVTRALFEYLDKYFGADYEEADNLFAQGLVSMKQFPKLFRTGEVVVTREDGQIVAFLTERCSYSDSSGKVGLQCHRLLFDGLFKRKEIDLSVDWPTYSDSVVQIDALSVYPLRFSAPGTKARLMSRGKVFWSCRNRRFVSYTAPSRTFEIKVVNPRYMIDMETYHQGHSKEGDTHRRQDALEHVDLDRDDPPSDEFTIMLPPKILGFGLHDKKWKNLLVEHIQKITWNKTAFDRLVLGAEKKTLITAMVKEHVLNDTATDVIEGKGNGLIILLHGAPGTGKTLTAESVAEVAEKPLYRVTCGDIGTDPEGVEKYLESVLYIATMWKAVVLFDESDVFLEERTQADLQRNALVSAFLRVLEYYDGILILTTNRVGIFDEACKSRMQLALHYPKLDEDGRLEIWNDFIHNLQQSSLDRGAGSKGINAEQLRGKVGILAREELNGRQIRNAIRTGRQLASHRSEPLGYEHLRAAIRVAKEFDRYIVETHGHTDEEFAKAQSLRA